MGRDVEVREVDLQKLFRKLNNLRGSMSVTRRKAILRKGARAVIRSIKTYTPRSKEPHKRYRSLGGDKKAGKGKGRPLATYRPGNLRRNVVELRHLGTRTGNVFVGVKVRGGGDDDAFYGRFVNSGTKRQSRKDFINKGIESAKAEAMELIKKELLTQILIAVK